MPLSLLPAQIEAFCKALAKAYSLQEFDEMLFFRLGMDRQDLAIADNKLEIILKVVRTAERQGWSDRFLIEALKSNPKSPELIAFAQSLGIWGIETGAAPTLEKLVRERGGSIDVIKFRKRYDQLIVCVCTVEAGTSMGTGFLVGPDLVLTNYHVVKQLIVGATSADTLLCRFDYKVKADGRVADTGRVVPLADKGVLAYQPYSRADTNVSGGNWEPHELDYAIIRVAERVGEQPSGPSAESYDPVRGWITLLSNPPQVVEGDPILVVQHPQDVGALPEIKLQPMQLSQGNVLGFVGGGIRLRHSAMTLPGSSGAPCCDASLSVVALHHASDPRDWPEYRGEYNQAVPISRIVADLKTKNNLERFWDVAAPSAESRPHEIVQPLRSAEQSEPLLDPTSLALPFVGRRKELAAIRDFIEVFREAHAQSAAILTIGGMGGVGKTWLTHQVIEEFGRTFSESITIEIDLHSVGGSSERIQTLRDFQRRLSDELSDRVGYKFDNYRALADSQLQNTSFKRAPQLSRQRSATWLSDFTSSLRRQGAPLLLALDNYEHVDFHRGVSGRGRRNLCHEWVVWMVASATDQPVFFVITGRDIDHASFHTRCSSHAQVELLGLSAPDIDRMLRAAHVPSSAEIARLLKAQTQGHPQTIQYIIEHAARNLIGKDQFLNLLKQTSPATGSQAHKLPGKYATLLRILRYSWDERYIDERRRTSAKIERAAFAALVMLSFEMPFPEQDEVIATALRNLYPNEGHLISGNPITALRHAFPSMFETAKIGVLHSEVSECLLQAIVDGNVTGVDIKHLSAALDAVVTLGAPPASAASGAQEHLLSPQWQTFETTRIALLAWRDQAAASHRALRMVLLSLIINPSDSRRLIADLEGQSGTRRLPWYQSLKRLRSSPQPLGADALAFLRAVAPTVSSPSLNSSVRLAIEVLQLRTLGSKRMTAHSMDRAITTSSSDGQFGPEEALDRTMFEELTIHYRFARGHFFAEQSNEYTEKAIAEYQRIFQNPGSFYPRTWIARAAGRLFDLYLRSGKFDSANSLKQSLDDEDRRAAEQKQFNLYLRIGMFEEAASLVPRMKDEQESLVEMKVAKQNWKNERQKQALECLRYGRLVEALETFLAVNKYFPNDPQIASNVIRGLRRLGRADEAEKWASSLRHNGTGDERSLVALGEFELMMGRLAIARGLFDLVTASLSKKANRSPKEDKICASATNHLAEVAMLTGDWALARDYFTRRIAFGVRFAKERQNEVSQQREINVLKHAYTKRGFAELLSDDKVLAAESFGRALEIDDKFYHARLGRALCETDWRAEAIAARRAIGEARSRRGISEVDDAIQQLDIIQIGALIDQNIATSEEVCTLAMQAKDVSKLLFFLKRTEAASRRFPENMAIQAIRDTVQGVATGRSDTREFS